MAEKQPHGVSYDHLKTVGQAYADQLITQQEFEHYQVTLPLEQQVYVGVAAVVASSRILPDLTESIRTDAERLIESINSVNQLLTRRLGIKNPQPQE